MLVCLGILEMRRALALPLLGLRLLTETAGFLSRSSRRLRIRGLPSLRRGWLGSFSENIKGGVRVEWF